jgi:hypothetical protein
MYAKSQAKTGAGTSLSIGSTAPVLIGELTEAPFDRPAWGTEDVTNFESPGASEHIATFLENKEITFQGNRVASDAGQAAVEAAYATGQPVAFTIQLPISGSQTVTGDSFTFSAIVVLPSFSLTPTKVVKFSLKVQPTGAWTKTAGS